jgi:hypothetical protein
MYRNQVAASSGIGWRIAAELSGDIKRNTQQESQDRKGCRGKTKEIAVFQGGKGIKEDGGSVIKVRG